MPSYNYTCATCGKTRAVLAKKLPGPVACVCGAAMRRGESRATSRVTEVLDNGFMSRSLERPADADRVFQERSRIREDRG